MLHTILFLLTLVALAVATFEAFIPAISSTRVNWLAAGMLLWALSRLAAGS